MPAAFLIQIPRFFGRGMAARSVASRRAEIERELEQLRARKRSYTSQLEHLDARRALDGATLYARAQLLELIAHAVSRELDLLDALDAL